MRLAGTAKQYSKKAMLHPTRIAVRMVHFGKRNWPYQAKVMKMFEIVSRPIVIIRIPDFRCSCGSAQHLSDDPLVDPRQRLNVLHGRAFPDLMHRRIGKPEVDDRAKLNQETAVRGAAARR